MSIITAMQSEYQKTATPLPSVQLESELSKTCKIPSASTLCPSGEGDNLTACCSLCPSDGQACWTSSL